MIRNEFEVHEGENYLKVKPLHYAADNGSDAELGQKVTNVSARQGYVGEVIYTIMKNGLTETKNIVSYDLKTGEADWIVKQASGEEMIVTNEKFLDLYQPMTDSGELSPQGKIRPIIKVNENICFYAPWGELQFLKKNGYLVILEKKHLWYSRSRV